MDNEQKRGQEQAPALQCTGFLRTTEITGGLLAGSIYLKRKIYEESVLLRIPVKPASVAAFFTILLFEKKAFPSYLFYRKTELSTCLSTVLYKSPAF